MKLLVGLARHPRAVLLAAGLASEAVYLFLLAVPFPLARYYAIPAADLGNLTHHGRVEGAIFVAAAAALFALYGMALKAAGHTPVEAGGPSDLCPALVPSRGEWENARPLQTGLPLSHSPILPLASFLAGLWREGPLVLR